MALLGTVSLSTHALASGYQLWEQDGGSIGNYHAGRAAIAEDASTAFYNPAGLVRIPNQQLVVAIDPITTDFLFDGTIDVSTFTPPNTAPIPTKSQGGTFNLVPSLNYAAPITNNLVFGLSVVAPFGLKTDYGDSTVARYSATLTSLRVIDFSPSLGIAFNDKFSFGAGLDVEHAFAQFGLDAGIFAPGAFDTTSQNKGSVTALGFHAGVLYQFSPETRVGLNYQSKVTLHLRHGDSDFEGPIANDFDGGRQSNNNLRTDLPLPAVTSLSIFHSFNPTWDVMATVSYTQWSVFDELILENVSGIDAEGDASNDITVVIPQNYRDTWNYAVGTNYHMNEQWFFRTGIGYDETPSNNNDRNLQLPDLNRFVLAVGAHFQATKALAFDVGWTHFFQGTTDIDVSQQFGAQETVTDGKVKASADVYGLQVLWNFV
jgi:long-chain fatty acid transport protein